MVAISLLLIALGILGGLIIAGIWAFKTAHGLTPSDIN